MEDMEPKSGLWIHALLLLDRLMIQWQRIDRMLKGHGEVRGEKRRAVTKHFWEIKINIIIGFLFLYTANDLLLFLGVWGKEIDSYKPNNTLKGSSDTDEVPGTLFSKKLFHLPEPYSEGYRSVRVGTATGSVWTPALSYVSSVTQGKPLNLSDPEGLH